VLHELRAPGQEVLMDFLIFAALGAHDLRAAGVADFEAPFVDAVTIHAECARRDAILRRSCPIEQLAGNRAILRTVRAAAKPAEPAVPDAVPQGAGLIVIPGLP
jgi:hypothetical protein